MSPTDIDRTVQPLFIVRADIQQHRQAMLRMNAAQRRIQRHLPDRNAHPSCTLIAEPQNAFAIADHNASDIIVVRVAQNLCDAIFVGIAEKQSARLSPDLAEPLAALAYRGRIDQRQAASSTFLQDQ